MQVVPVWTRLSLSTNIRMNRGDVKCHYRVLWQRGSKMSCPNMKIMSTMVYLGSVLRIISPMTEKSINTFNFREGDEELKTFPSSRPTDLCMRLNHSTGTIYPLLHPEREHKHVGHGSSPYLLHYVAKSLYAIVYMVCSFRTLTCCWGWSWDPMLPAIWVPPTMSTDVSL